jgi:hypothetical protein
MAEGRIALAALAGNTLVAAATTGVWEVAGRKLVPLLGGGDRKKEELAERRLQETRQQLERVSGRELEKARADLGRVWQVRLADLLEEDPAVEAELGAVVKAILAQLPARTVAAAGHAAAGQDVNISAAEAMGRPHGDVVPPGPTRPGPVGGLPGPRPGSSVRARSPPRRAGWRSVSWCSNARRWRVCRYRWVCGRHRWRGGRSCWPT